MNKKGKVVQLSQTIKIQKMLFLLTLLCNLLITSKVAV